MNPDTAAPESRPPRRAGDASRLPTAARRVATLLLTFSIAAAPQSAPAANTAAAPNAASAASAANDFSAAERMLFVDNHLKSMQPPQTLHYTFRKSGTLEPAFDDSVDVKLAAQAGGGCCAASARFLTGDHALPMPEVEGAQGNPAILYFLEREIREMERLTKGKANYFRKRLRMAIFQGATIRQVTLPFKGRPVAVSEIAIAPYLDDPNRSRYEKLANKRYVFQLTPDVPGGLYGIHTRIDGATADAPPLLIEQMALDGAAPAPTPRKP